MTAPVVGHDGIALQRENFGADSWAHLGHVALIGPPLHHRHYPPPSAVSRWESWRPLGRSWRPKIALPSAPSYSRDHEAFLSAEAKCLPRSMALKAPQPAS